jgi:hypothetical protein
MLEMMALYLDEDGLPRAHAVGYIETNTELDDLKSVAVNMLDKYIESKPYLINKSDYTLSIEIVDTVSIRD